MKWLIFGGIALLLIVNAAVLGGVLGSRPNNKSSSASSSSLSPSPPSSLSNTSSSPNASSPSSSSSSSSDANAPLQPRQKLAALSFSTNSVDSTRIYYQDNAGEMVEAASSTNDNRWINTNLGFFAKNGSAIGAAVSRPGFPHEITVVYTDSENLIHNVVYNSTTNRWAKGELSSQNFISSSDSSLSVTYNQCAKCENSTIIAYQDVNGFVQIGVQTSAGWGVEQLALNPIVNTGLAFQSYPNLYNELNSTRLYYQKSDLNLSMISWPTKWVGSRVHRWFENAEVAEDYHAAAPGTPIAVAIIYSSPFAATGDDIWAKLLLLSATGIEVKTWSEEIRHRINRGKHPPSMRNSTANPKTFGAVATINIGQAFAVVSTNDQKYAIETWRIVNLTSWIFTGPVNIGSAWD